LLLNKAVNLCGKRCKIKDQKTTIKTRCQIILLEVPPMSVPQIAKMIFSSEDTVARFMHEFHQSRLERKRAQNDAHPAGEGGC
jgi:hypothetical protein